MKNWTVEFDSVTNVLGAIKPQIEGDQVIWDHDARFCATEGVLWGEASNGINGAGGKTHCALQGLAVGSLVLFEGTRMFWVVVQGTRRGSKSFWRFQKKATPDVSWLRFVLHSEKCKERSVSLQADVASNVGAFCCLSWILAS